MSNELVTVFGSDDFNEIAALTGAAVFDNQLIPALRINRDAETEDGKRIPTGTYSISQNSRVIYGLPAKFRPFINTYQYLHYDGVKEEFVNKSIYIKNFREEAHDELGGLRCGKVSKDAFEQLSQDDQANQRSIQCYRVLFGTVSFRNAVDADGNAYDTIDAVPCMWRMRGVNFNAPDTALKAITKLRHHFFQHNLILNTKRDKKGSNIFYHSIVEADLANVLELTVSDVETFKVFNDPVDDIGA